MSPQTETKASVGFKAGVKDYKLTYYTPEYETKDTNILAAFRVTPHVYEYESILLSLRNRSSHLRLTSSGVFFERIYFYGKIKHPG